MARRKPKPKTHSNLESAWSDQLTSGTGVSANATAHMLPHPGRIEDIIVADYRNRRAFCPIPRFKGTPEGDVEFDHEDPVKAGILLAQALGSLSLASLLLGAFK